MADYYSLLARAVAASPQSGPEARQAVYERARKALMNQLRSIQPPVADADIASEGRALDEAIARLELELVKKGSAATQPPGKPATPQQPAQPGRSPQFTARSAAPAEAANAASPASPAPDEDFGDYETSEPPREKQRPAAPLPPLPRPASGSRRILVILAILTVVAGAVGLAAWQFRERPEELANLKPEDGASDSSSSGKIADRVGETGDHAPSTGVQSTKPSGNGVPIAQKAELWVSAPEEASKVKTYPGSVVWRLENVGQGPGQATTSAIRGDVDIPSAKTKLTLVFQKNTDAALSATHTVNVSFQVAPSSDLKGVKAIGQIQMRRPEAQNGEKIVGIPVPITDNNFLIGLMRGDREARNMYLLRQPMIIDLPMQLSDGRAATISLEKGPVGERVFSDALDQWSRP